MIFTNYEENQQSPYSNPENNFSVASGFVMARAMLSDGGHKLSASLGSKALKVALEDGRAKLRNHPDCGIKSTQ